MKNKNINKLFIIVSVCLVLLVGFFVIYISNERISILKNGKDFEAKCLDVYTRKGSGRTKLGHHKTIKVYVFEVTSPSEIKGEKFEKTKKRYFVGRTYKGKYIDNGKNTIMKNKYEYQIIE